MTTRNDDNQPLRTPPSAGEPVVQSRRSESAVLDALAKEVTALRVVFASVVALVFFTLAASSSWNNKADATSVRMLDQRVTNIEQVTKTGGIIDIRLQNIERSQAWQLDTMWQGAKRDGLAVAPPPQPAPIPVQTLAIVPDPSPVQTPANRPR